MKIILRFTFLVILATAFSAARLPAQKLVIGERAPEVKIQKWLISQPTMDGKAVMVEFFHPSNEKSGERIAKLNALASANNSNIVVVVMAKDESGNAVQMLTSGSPSYYPAIDDGGKTFTAFGVKYIPYAVLYDKRGRILWLGNPNSISNEEITGYIR